MNKDVNKILPVVLCGGKGTRLWPLSRASFPKQYLEIKPNNSLTFFQETIYRIKKCQNIYKPIVICNEEHRFIAAEQLRQIDINDADILLEPIARNTAPAITIASLRAVQNYEDPIIIVLPSDHIIEDVDTFNKALEKAIYYAKNGKIVTFGITPNKPETGFGYIESKNNLNSQDLNGEEIVRFIEKPDKRNAEKFLKDKKFTWNSGIFLFQASTMLNQLEDKSIDIYKYCKQSLSLSKKDLDFQRLDKDTFASCKNISIDKEIMEKTDVGIVIPLNAGWSDVGSWQSMWEVAKKDNMGNVIEGDVLVENVKNSYIRSEDRLIIGFGLENLVVVETKDALLVCDKGETQNVKKIVQNLDLKGKLEANVHKTIFRPWGNYTSIADGKNWQVKKIIVKPYQSLSLQLHKKRTEHWIVVDGIAKIEIDGEITFLKKNESTYIPKGSKHRLSNHGEGTLILIEVQSGDYLGEDDIIRFEDNYGRA